MYGRCIGEYTSPMEHLGKITFPVFHPTIIRKTRQPPRTIHGSCLQICQGHFSFRSGCKLILIAYIHNGDCCYELRSIRELRKIASLRMTLQHAACHTAAPQLLCFQSMFTSPLQLHDPHNKIRRSVASL